MSDETTTTDEAVEDKPKGDEPKTYTQEELDRITAATEATKNRLEAENRRLADEAERLKKANETEQEKLVREAREAGLKEAEDKYAIQARVTDIRLELVANGADPDQAAELARIAPEGDAKEAAAALVEKYKPLFTRPKQSLRGADGGTTDRPKQVEEWTPERVTQLLDEEGTAGYIKHKADIDAYKAKIVGSTVRHIPAGTGAFENMVPISGGANKGK